MQDDTASLLHGCVPTLFSRLFLGSVDTMENSRCFIVPRNLAMTWSRPIECDSKCSFGVSITGRNKVTIWLCPLVASAFIARASKSSSWLRASNLVVDGGCNDKQKQFFADVGYFHLSRTCLASPFFADVGYFHLSRVFSRFTPFCRCGLLPFLAIVSRTRLPL